MSDPSSNPGSGLRVLKFGGTSLADPDRVRAVAAIVSARAAAGPTVMVVSAFGSVTDDLIAAGRSAEQGDPEYLSRLHDVRARHSAAAADLAAPGETTSVDERIGALFDELDDLLLGVSLVKECTARTWDQILSFGERLSATLVAAALRAAGTPAEACDARDLIVTDDNFGRARVDVDASRGRVSECLGQSDPLQVVTGFIAATPEGDTTTLGRGGSDHTATLVGAMLGAEAVEIWTDVDGVMTADPRIVPEAFSIPSLGYDELMELSHWGADVMHPASVHTARDHHVPLVIRNTLNPEFPGTSVVERPSVRTGYPVRGIASIADVALLRLEGDGMQGVPGIAQRLFGALARERISVILITQASSERSICFAIEPVDLDPAVKVIQGEFALERGAGLVDDVVVEERRSVIAAVGEGMRETPGIAGRLFGVLGHSRINVRAIAQGSSELNISMVVAQEDSERALRAVHRAFFRPHGRTVQLFVAGVGRVGAEFLDQVAAQSADLLERGLEVRLVGVARSATAVLNEEGVDLAGWRDALAEGSDELRDMVNMALESDHPSRLFVDATASKGVVEWYEPLLREGVAVISANKLAFSGPADRFESLREMGERGMGLLFETTVGAGLPVLRTIQDLVSTGDTIHKIEGVLSGTLGFICDRLMAGEAFSAAVAEADRRGFTEPDPREDLGGRDVARKLVILGRVAGLPMELDDVDVERLLPEAGWATGTLDEFWAGLSEVDADFAARRDRAVEDRAALCYLAAIEDGRASVRLASVSADHPCAGLASSDNLVAITTDRYAETPLVVQGPGAGPEVTAAGVFADVLRVLAESR